MIFVCAFVAIAILTVVAAITIFLHPTRFAKMVVIYGIILCILLGCFCGVSAGICNANIKSAKAQYDDLMLYYYTVMTSTNEYLRYDYYNKVNEFNAEYNHLVELSESKWSSWFCDKTALAEFGTIDFILHGDGYGEG